MDKQDVVAFWGERCPEFCPTCTSCQAWLWFEKAGIILGVQEAVAQTTLNEVTMEANTSDQALSKLYEISKQFNEAMDELEKEQEQYWESLTKEQQLDVFCCVARRIYEGEIRKRGTYRYVLYNVFGFGPEAYAPAQLAGYLAIHNSLYDGENKQEDLIKFGEKYGIEDCQAKVEEFLHGGFSFPVKKAGGDTPTDPQS